MLNHLIAVLALAALCAAWVLFQSWLKRVDPGARGVEDATGCSGNCRPRRDQGVSIKSSHFTRSPERS